MTDPLWLTPAQVARRWSVSADFVRARVRSGTLAAAQMRCRS